MTGWKRGFTGILAGAGLRDRLAACAGTIVGIGLTAAIGRSLGFGAQDLPVIIAPIGASAVLVFAVPSSPLAQPWPVIGGNVISALIGTMVGASLADPVIASAIAVSVAILAMSLLRCLHPPGGAAALTAVIGGPAIHAAGLAFPFGIVAINSATLLLAAWLFHRLSGHSYPHRAGMPASMSAPVPALLHRRDIEQAIDDMGETFDIALADLDALLTLAEVHAQARRNG